MNFDSTLDLFKRTLAPDGSRPEVLIGGVRFLGCALWTDFALQAQPNVLQLDFRATAPTQKWARPSTSGLLRLITLIRSKRVSMIARLLIQA